RHHDGFALAASARSRGDGLGTGVGLPRGEGAFGASVDDGVGDGVGLAANRAGQRRGGPRDRGTAGAGHSGTAVDLDGPDRGGIAAVVSPVRFRRASGDYILARTRQQLTNRVPSYHTTAVRLLLSVMARRISYAGQQPNS